MANKNSYFDNDLDIKRNNRRKKKRRKKAIKSFFTALGLIVAAVAVFVITVKVCNPDADLKELIPEQVVQLFEKPAPSVSEKTTASEITETAPAPNDKKPETEAQADEIMDYLDFGEFDFNSSIQGNFLGNLLNGGLVGTDMTYEYHIVSGKGIYKFNPTTEDYTCCYKTSDELEGLNLRGDYIYFINKDKGNLCKLKKGDSKPKTLAGDVKFVYVYDSTVYYLTKANSLCIMDVKQQSPKVLYTADSGTMRFVGISLNRVFFTISDDNKNTDYYSVNNSGEELYRFRESTTDGKIAKLYMENGFMYYYLKQENGTYSLCRQKFGSDNIVNLVKNIKTDSFAVVDMNKMFYSMLEDGKYKLIELNMNTDEDKTMLTVNSAKEKNSLKFYHGAEYDFVIGKKADGTSVYSASSMLTASTNVMNFSGSGWSY